MCTKITTNNTVFSVKYKALFDDKAFNFIIVSNCNVEGSNSNRLSMHVLCFILPNFKKYSLQGNVIKCMVAYIRLIYCSHIFSNCTDVYVAKITISLIPHFSTDQPC